MGSRQLHALPTAERGGFRPACISRRKPVLFSPSMFPNRVVITGVGAVSPLGNSAPATWQSLIAGRSGVGPITQFDSSDMDTHFAAEVKGFEASAHFGAKESRRLDRCVQFALVATKEALADSGLAITDANADETAVIYGSGIGGITTLLAENMVLEKKGPRRVSPFAVPMMLPDTATGQIAIHFGIRGPNICTVTACASSNNAIGEAFEMIRAGRVTAAVAGGCESPITRFTVAAFHNMGATSTRNDNPAGASRPFDKNRDGFVSGEGAATLILESLESARARGARIYAEIVGYGATCDAHHITAPNMTGPAMAMRAALRQSGLAPNRIDYINAHGTSTQINDANETAAIKAVFGEVAYDLRISSTKSMTGHLLGGAGAMEAMTSVMAIQEGIIPPTINYETPDPACDLNYTPNTAVRKPVRAALSNSFGFGGHNASVIFSALTD